MQKKSGSYDDGPSLSSIHKGKAGGKTRTASVSSPSNLETGTREGTGGIQEPSASKRGGDGAASGGGHAPQFGNK